MPTPQAENSLFVEQARKPILGNGAISQFKLLLELAADLTVLMHQVCECHHSRLRVRY